MKKNILFILPFMPYPLESGGHQALFNGIKAIKDDYNVLVAYPAIDNEDYRRKESAFLEVLSGISVLPMLSQEVHLTRLQCIYLNIKGVVKKLLGIKPVQYLPNIYDGWISAVAPLNAQWGVHLNRIFSDYEIDIVQVEMPWMIGAIYNIPQKARKVFVHHEIGFVRHQLEYGDTQDTTVLAYADFTKMVEVNLLNKYDAIITLSQTDKEKLIKEGITTPVYSSFAVVDTGEYQPVDKVDKMLSFVGSDNHNPNYEGLLWFLNKCWKTLKTIDDSYRLRIIGKWSDDSKNRILSQFVDVEFLGYVNDLGQAIKGTIMIVPITIGSGIRMKILEAASRGVPIVSTTVGAEGLPVEDGVQCLVKDRPDDFVKGILSLQEPNLMKSICYEAHEMVKSNYSVEALRDNRLSVMQSVL